VSEDKQEEAARFARRAAKQAKDAGKNTIRMTQAGTGAVAEFAVDEFEDTAHKLEGTAEDAARKLRGADLRLVLASSAVILGATYLVGRVVGYRNAKAEVAEILTAPVEPVV
jgi:hypothetical protein